MINSIDESIFIRPFLAEDYAAVRTLWDAAGLPYKPDGRDSEDAVRLECGTSTALFYVAELKGRIVGVIFGTHDGRKGWINRLAVHPDNQHSGIARRLVKTVEDVLESKGIDIVACLIEDWNASSLSFFKKNGYISHPEIQYFSKRKSENT